MTSAYQKVSIFLFSGTGNSRTVARWFSKVAASKGAGCDIIDIAQTDRKSITPPEEGSLVAFVSPVHGFNYPPVMLHYIMRFPKGKNKVLLLNTRAGMLIGKFITPGLSGITFYLSALVLILKGYTVKAMLPIDLPSNWTSLHPGLNDRTIKFLHEKNQEKVSAFATKVLDGKKEFGCLREIIQDLLVAPIAALYYFIGRFIIAKTNYASHACNQCGLCIKECPVKAIIRVDQRPFWTYRCESCMKCMGNCPQKAIETSHGFFIGFLILFNTLLMGIFYQFFNQYFFVIENGFLRMLVEALLTLLFLALFYRIFHLLMHFKVIEKIMVYTSLTSYKFWGKRYKAPKAK